MKDFWKIIVLVVKHMLQHQRSFIEHPNKIVIIVSDGVYSSQLVWKE